MNGKYLPTIGLEIHVELSTRSKMFCACSASHFTTAPNTQTCPVCLGLPGALPVPNEKAILWTQKIGLALNSELQTKSKFDRKHYFYPDLPKGYQISQYDEPLCLGGFLETSLGRVGITRVHLEEDTAKLQHKTINSKKVTLVDFNRSGIPLVEIVSEPEIHSGQQAREYAQKLQRLIRFLGVSDCDMEKGTLRLEANISLGLNLGYKVEVKNLNSFRFVKKAIDYELSRQQQVLESGKVPRQETRGFDEQTNHTVTQRFKETAADYRYFPEPDIPPLSFSPSHLKSLEKEIPLLPEKLTEKFIKNHQVRPEYAFLLAADLKTAGFAEQAFRFAEKSGLTADQIAGEIVNKPSVLTNTSPEQLVNSLVKLKSGKISNLQSLDLWVKEAIAESQAAVDDYQKGKTAALSVLIGLVMRKSQGKAEANLVRNLLEKHLNQ